MQTTQVNILQRHNVTEVLQKTKMIYGPASPRMVHESTWKRQETKTLPLSFLQCKILQCQNTTIVSSQKKNQHGNLSLFLLLAERIASSHIFQQQAIQAAKGQQFLMLKPQSWTEFVSSITAACSESQVPLSLAFVRFKAEARSSTLSPELTLAERHDVLEQSRQP